MIIRLRKLKREDLPNYQHWQLPHHPYHQLNGPYFPKLTEAEVAAKMEKLAAAFEQGNADPLPDKRLITNEQEELIGGRYGNES